MVNCASAHFDGGFGGAPVPGAAPVKSDLPYIRCGVCEALAKHALRIVETVTGTLKSGKKVGVSLLQGTFLGDNPQKLYRSEALYISSTRANICRTNAESQA